jgi:hypothetical protein
MEARIEHGNLVITLPLEEPRTSSSGKSQVVATSYGLWKTNLRVKGKLVAIVANAIIPLEDAEKNKKPRRKRIDNE